MDLIRVIALLTASFFAVAAVAAPAGESGEPPRAGKAGQPATEKAAEELLSAVVRVKMKAIPGAHSNASLGEIRDGTGVVIDERGYIVTIGYIVIEADAIEITTQDNKTVPATLVGYDHASGFGLLKSSLPPGVKAMPMGQADNLALREPVMILPAGGREMASFAYVVSRRKFAGSWEYLLENAIFTSPPTLQWAGAALVNRDGKLVGIGSLLVRDSVEPGMPLPGNMFVPIDLLQPILSDLIEKGRRSGPPRPWLGLATEEVQNRLFVTRVSPDGPADMAGIRPGDIVVGVGGDAVASQEDFYRRMWSLGAAGTEVPLKILQGADVREIKVRSIDRFQYFKEKPTY
ncbi:MAG: S1C family serine protease [Burkholderiales bacterium]